MIELVSKNAKIEPLEKVDNKLVAKTEFLIVPTEMIAPKINNEIICHLGVVPNVKI